MALVDARFTILGPTGMRVGDRVDTQWGPSKERALLAVLLTRPGSPVPAAELIDWVWSDERELPKNPTNALHLYSSRIRTALESLPNQVELLVGGGSFQIKVDRNAVDYFRFLDLVDRARELAQGGDHQQALVAIRSAFTIWQRQVPLADLSSDRAEAWRRKAVLNRQMPAYNLLCEELLVLGRYGEVLEVLDDLDPDYRLHPALLKRRLDALYRLMRTEEATQLYLAMHKAFRVDQDDMAADDLREFHDGLRENRVVPAEPVVGSAVVPVPQQLPLDVSVFVGRQDEFAALDAATAEPGVTVLGGVGGVGKTAFVVHWAHTRRSRFPQGVLFVDLQGFSDGAVMAPSSVVDRFLQGLGVSPDRIANPDHRVAKLQSLLAGRRLLIVLDNARDERQIEGLLPLFPSCVVVVTSRSRLSGLEARLTPRRISIDPLEAEAGSRLLLDRIGQRGEGTSALLELTSVCCGLPLALKVLANHIATRPGVRLSAFVDHFRERGVLDIGTMHGPRAVFMQSLRALESDARLVFRAIGAHPAPDVSVSAVAAMVELPPRRAHEAMDALVEAHLLEQASELDRFKLHDLLREFSVSLLEDPEERTRIERRMLDFYLRTAENADMLLFPTMVRVPTSPSGERVDAIDFSDPAAAQLWCTVEIRSILAVVGFAVETAHFAYATQIALLMEAWVRNGRTAEMLTVLGLGLVAAKALGADAIATAADLMQQIGHTHLLRQEYRQAERHVHSAHIAYLQAGGDQRSGIASCLHTGARILVDTGSIHMGIDSHERALAIVREIEEVGMEVFFLCRAGEAYQKAFEYERADSYYHQALILSRAQGEEWAEAAALQLLGSLAFSRERVDEARSYAEQALRKYARRRAVGGVGGVCALLCEIEAEAGDLWRAKQYARQAIRFCGSAGASLSEATALRVLSRILERAGQRDGAVEALERARVLLLEQDVDRADQMASELDRLRAEIDLPTSRNDSPVVDHDPEVR
ncbi:AfsR/SARP family transcriptional regulator [Lentzea sp.]|uniref:AfsR/SARP family transcriptional regulator n=1 Tax=Lentzea sp. TaxID=56099 RepID=UPI002ED5021C